MNVVVGCAIVIGCASLVGLDAWRTWQARDVALVEDEAETANLTRSLTQHMHDLIQAVNVVLASVAEQAAQPGGLTAGEAQLRTAVRNRVAELPSLHSIVVYDAHGAPVVWSDPGPLVSKAVADQAYFVAQRDTAGLGALLAKPIQEPSDGRWGLAVSRRLTGPDGRFEGVVVGVIEVQFIKDFYATLGAGTQGVVTLLMADGVIVARNPDTQGVSGSTVALGTFYRRFLSQAPVGTFRYTSVLEGTERLGSFRRVPGYPLIVVVAHGVDAVLEDWRRDAIIHLLISSGVAAALGIVGLRLARQMRERQQTERQYRLLADNSSDAIICIGMDGQCLYVSPSFEGLTGWSVATSLRKGWMHGVHPADRPLLEDGLHRLQAGERSLGFQYRYVRPDGAALWVEAKCHFVPESAGAEAQFVGNIRDITSRREAEEVQERLTVTLAAQANTDGLTGLANRRRLDEALRQEWRRMGREQSPLSLVLLDIDRFKRFNDNYGHPEGDRCLRAIAETVAAFARRPGDVVARYGGEEILLLLPSTDGTGAMELAERIRGAIEARGIAHSGNPPLSVVTSSFGVSTLVPQPSAEHGYEGLLAQADAALYEAKRLGRNRIVEFVELPAYEAVELDAPERLAAVAAVESALRAPAAAAGAGGTAIAIEELDRLAHLTATLFHVPVALISLVGGSAQTFVGKAGLELNETSRNLSFCAHTVLDNRVMCVPDARLDPRFADNLLVTGEQGIRFYAGAPILNAEGQPLGALCIIDKVPQLSLNTARRTLLADLAGLAGTYLHSHVAGRRNTTLPG